jgi:hypothetical protein
MKFNPKTKEVFSDDNIFIKKLSCHLTISEKDLIKQTSQIDICRFCKKEIFDTSYLSDSELLNLFKLKPNTCIKLDVNQPNLKLTDKTITDNTDNKEIDNLDDNDDLSFEKENKLVGRKLKNKFRVIKTARTIDAIKKAINKGLRPLIKKINPSEKIRVNYCVFQNLKTGEIIHVNDFREAMSYENSRFEKVINWSKYYPYKYDLPYAAYLIPADLKPDELVLLEDLIEDYLGENTNQGNYYRLQSAEAIWNGKDFEIKYNPKKEIKRFIG